MSPSPHAKKSLGQHFLHDERAIRRIVDLLDIREGDKILEIGPGPGALTALLRETPFSRLVLLEKDDRFAAEHAAKPLSGGRRGLEVVHGDALAFDWASLTAEPDGGGGWKIAGNLPYNIASPLMWDIVSQAPAWERAVFMIQKEVADRILASPGTKAYGGLTVWLRSFAVPRRGFNLGPGAFSPPPAVDSSVVVFTPLPKEALPGHPDALSALVKICFGQRRKQLGTIVRNAVPGVFPEFLSRLGIDPQRRPETLTPQEFQRFSNALRAENLL